jgi:FG-GAP repeat
MRRAYATGCATAIAAIAVAAAWAGPGTFREPGTELVGANVFPGTNFGSGVALSAKGGYALIGGAGWRSDVGSAWVFARTGSRWRQDGQQLFGPANEASRFGLRVALSGDGRTALVGAPIASTGAGAAWVYVRRGAGWRPQGGPLAPANHSKSGAFGSSVALSADGNTAIVGSPGDRLANGAVSVLMRTGSTWRATALLTGRDESGPGRFGTSVALSASGRTAVVGGPTDENQTGAVWVFTRTGTTWTPQGGKLTPGGHSPQRQLGASVAISADGGTILAGAPVDDEDVGTAWVYTRSGSGWKRQGGALAPAPTTVTVQFGGSVSLSGSGNTALVGGAANNGDVGRGAVWVFTRDGSTWTQDGRPLTARGEKGVGAFGSGVAVSADGKVALVGAYVDGGAAGAAWAYLRR